MKSKTTRTVLIVILSALLLLGATITVMAVTPSNDSSYNSTLQEVYSRLSGRYKKSKDAYTQIVAYVNGEPIYYADVVAERAQRKLDGAVNYALRGNDQATEWASGMSDSYMDILEMIAASRAVALEAEKFGFVATEQAIRDEQKRMREDLERIELYAEKGAATEVEAAHNQLLQVLDLSEDEYIETYQYMYIKYRLLVGKLLSQMLDERFPDPSDRFAPEAALIVYREVLSKYDYKVVIEDEPKT